VYAYQNEMSSIQKSNTEPGGRRTLERLRTGANRILHPTVKPQRFDRD
jgi:hypothetical protein